MKKITFLIVAILFTTVTINAQISESFEGSFPPTGWAAFPGISGTSDAEWQQQDDVWNGRPGYAHTGDFAAISSFDWEGLTEGWLVTPQFTPTATEHILYFYQRQLSNVDYFSEYTVRVSTASQTTHADFTVIDTQDETDVPMVYGLRTVDLSAYIDTPIYIAFVHAQDDDDEWYIDDVLTEEVQLPGATLNPVPADDATDITIINSQTSHIDFSWEAPTTGGTISQYDLYISANADNLRLIGHPTNFEASPSTFHFNTTYYWKAAAVNMGGENSPTWSFTTVNQPTLDAPYTIDFENNGFVPDGCDQAVTNEKWWEYSDTIGEHIGNNGDSQGTTTESGGYFAFIDDSDNPNSLNTTFKTPFINLYPLTNPELSFYMLSNGEGGGNVDFTVKIGTDDIGWTTVFTSNTDTNGWEKQIIDLSGFDTAYAVQAKFIIDENSSTTKDDFAIDDIKFASSETSDVSDNTIENLSYFPNPVKDNFIIKSSEKINNIHVIDLLGRIVMNVYPNSTETALNTSDLASGNYLVKIFTDNKQNTIKMVKK